MLKEMRKLKILHVAATSTGGVGLNIILLSRYLKKDQFDISVAMAMGSPLDEEFIKEGVTIHPLHMSRKPHRLINLFGLYQLWRLIGAEKFDIVHTHTSVGGFLGRIAARARGVPVVLWSIHGWAFHYPMGSISRIFWRTIERFLDFFTDHYVAVSRNMMEVGIQGSITTPEKVSVIYHGIEVDAYDTPVNQNNLRKELGIGENIPLVGNIGRMEPQKAVDDFLKAAKFVKGTIQKVKFLIVGDGPLKHAMEKLSIELGIQDDVLFVGWKKNIKDYASIMDVVCMPSLWEALPFLLLEVMALRKPVVATRVGGIPEVVEDGKTGILVPPSKPEIMARAIIDIIANKRTAEEMGKAARQRVQHLFSVEKMIMHYERLYLNLFMKSTT